MSEEIDVSTCRGCEKLKVRKHDGSFDGKNKKFVDEEGKLWNGRICPACHKARVKTQLKQKRTDAKSRTDSKD